ncbi:GAF and ANTAR domain-containing protein [uncultured Friedmanniella sp.]|uniref:GAF and ANTAR domain-containing protein n=1 Tax=uncultured Friedmanniella sp. TaxID=335381 RepID=UPI0035CBC1F2
MQSLLLSFADVDAFLEGVAGLAAELFPGASVGITARYAGSVLTVASSDDQAELLDETQYDRDGGPCLQALNTGLAVESADVATETRWPAYCVVARGQGLRASLSLPMIAGGVTLAALNVYSFDPAVTFGTTERRQCVAFARHAAVLLRLATRQQQDGILLAQLEAALNSRTVIDQALGIIMTQQRCTAAQAFDLLRRYSQNSNRKLREVATDLVAQISGGLPGPGKPFGTD